MACLVCTVQIKIVSTSSFARVWLWAVCRRGPGTGVGKLQVCDHIVVVASSKSFEILANIGEFSARGLIWNPMLDFSSQDAMPPRAARPRQARRPSSPPGRRSVNPLHWQASGRGARAASAAGSEDPEAAAEGGCLLDHVPLPVLSASEGLRWRGQCRDNLPERV